jgi:DNA-binding XRE family transcriptional regulator
MGALNIFNRKLAAGEEELLPAAMVKRFLASENRLRVWRDHRGLPAVALAQRAGIALLFVTQIETGKREGTVETMRKLASALSITIDDLVG